MLIFARSNQTFKTMENKKENTSLSYKFLLKTTPETAYAIDKKMLLMERLYKFIVFSICEHIEYMKERTEFGKFSEEISNALKQMEEFEKRKRELDKDIDTEELKAITVQEKQIKENISELFKKKQNFLQNNPYALVRIPMLSRRKQILLQEDKLTPVDTESFVLNKSPYDGKLYYADKSKKDKNGFKTYTIVPGSIHHIETGGYKATLSECLSKTVDAVQEPNSSTYTFKDKVWTREAVIKDFFIENSKPKFTIFLPVEILRLDSSGNDYKNFCSKYSTEFVYSLKKNKNTGRTQKTGMTYSDYNFTTRDLMYSLGGRLYASFKDFPKERKHRSNEFDILSSGDTSTMIDLIEKDSQYFVSLKTTHNNTIEIPIIECPRNKQRTYSMETNYDRMLLNTAFAQRIKKNKAEYSIIRERIRDNIKYYLKVNINENDCPKRPVFQNSLAQHIGSGIVGIDPNAHMIAAVTSTGSLARIFSKETVDSCRVMNEIKRNEDRIKEVQTLMSKSIADTNPKAIDENGRYIKGCGLKLYKSKKYFSLKKELKELHRRNVELNKYIANRIAHEILSMGNIVYSELPIPQKAAERQIGIKKDKNGKTLSNRENGRNVQKFAIAGLLNEIRRIFLKNNGEWYWISNKSGATKYSPDGNDTHHKPNERVINLCGYQVQRDLKSAFCIANSVIVKQDINQKTKSASYRKQLVYDVQFDKDNIMEHLQDFVYSNNAEMNRLKNMRLEEYTIGIDEFFNKN